jgi:hypothetical protein
MGPEVSDAESAAVPPHTSTGATTAPAQNQAISDAPNRSSVSGKSRTAKPPAARKPAPGSHSPRPAACQPGDASTSTGSRPTAQTTA